MSVFVSFYNANKDFVDGLGKSWHEFITHTQRDDACMHI